jgi:hypothetical protein
MKKILAVLVLVGAVLALPAAARAQEAAIQGTLTDTTGGVLPGVTVTAQNDANGNVFLAVSDGTGAYRVAVSIGAYTLTAELPGFSTVVQSGVVLLIGQEAIVNLEMAVSTLQETVTVTGEAPILNTTSSDMGGNIDARQMQDIPVLGRNWANLATLAPGNRTNSGSTGGGSPVAGTSRRDFQINVDGQQVTSNLTGSTSQPRISQDAIAEFQFVSSRFDATQGRSSGVQVNAITKSGTNTFLGTLSGYFRDDKFNAADPISGKVLPYEQQQVGVTVGGPLITDRMHFFGYAEYDRNPSTVGFDTIYPSFNFLIESKRKTQMAGMRVDYQISPQTRLMVKTTHFRNTIPYAGNTGANNHPASLYENETSMGGVAGSLTQVLGDSVVNEIRGGWQSMYYTRENYTSWPSHPAASQGITTGSPRIKFKGFAISGNSNQPQYLGHNYYPIRDDLAFSFTASGRHDIKMGGEYIYYDHRMQNVRNGMGVIDAQRGRAPKNLEELFPVWDKPETWNLDAISPLVRRYTMGIGEFEYGQTRHVAAGWFQDDWSVSDRLTLNMGVRWDSAIGVFANEQSIEPWLEANRPGESFNLAPRFGFAFSIDDRTVLRGGGGIYYGEVLNNISSFTKSYGNTVQVQLENDGRADFASNPFNGPIPTFAEARQRLCTVNDVAGCLRPFGTTIAPPPNWAHIPHSYQGSIGVSRQLTDTMAVEADFVYTGGRNERFGQGHQPQFNMNTTFDPSTGINYPFKDISKRFNPQWGVVQYEVFDRRSNYRALQTSMRKRFSNRWQGAATYTLGSLSDSDPLPISGFDQVTFTVPGDLGGEYGIAETNQKHRAVLNGIFDVGRGFQVSGLYMYGSGEHYDNYYGGDPRGTGRSNSRLRGRDTAGGAKGTIVARNSLIGTPIHRVDLRLQQRVPLGDRMSATAMFEVFNALNHENYGKYTLNESNKKYGQARRVSDIAYLPRMLQLGVRLEF